MESASAPRLSSSNWSRSWNGFGWIAETAISWRPGPSPEPGAGRATFSPAGIRAPSPLPSPPGRATAHLLGQIAIRLGAARRRVEHDDRLTERWRLAEAHGPGDDGLVDLGPEVRPDLRHHLVG